MAQSPLDISRTARRPSLMMYSKLMKITGGICVLGAVAALFGLQHIGIMAFLSGMVSAIALFALAEFIIMFIDVETNQIEQTKLLAEIAQAIKTDKP